MATFSANPDSGQSCCCLPGTGGDQFHRESHLSDLLHYFRRCVDAIRDSDDSAGGEWYGPADLALTVVGEALAIGEAMSRLAVASAEDERAREASPAIYAEIDSRFVDHRARALRSALHGVDDYVWWGGLATAGR